MKNIKYVFSIAIIFSILMLSVSFAALCPATGGVHVWQSANCTEPRTCQNCDETQGSALGHKYEKGSSTSSKVSTTKTCLKISTVYKCARCFVSYTDVTYDYSHNYGSWKTTKEATCTEKGSKKRTCNDCGYVDGNEIAALGHEWKYLDPEEHRCTRCSSTMPHKIEGGSTTLHRCTDCNTEANATNGWPKYHYYSAWDKRCEFCDKAKLTVAFNFESFLPTAYEYYMVGCSEEHQGWEKSLKEITATTSQIPYSNASNTSYLSLKLNLQAFTHGNWAQHASAWNDYDTEDENLAVTTWPADNIDKPFPEWEKNIGTWLNGATKVLTLTRNSDNKSFKYNETIPNGHWSIDGYGHGENMNSGFPSYLFVNGNCSTVPTNIRAIINVAYRDTSWNKIDGAPNTRSQVTVWTDHDHKASYTAKANHNNLDSLGWRYVGYKVFKTYNVPETAANPTKEGAGASVTVNPSLGDQKYTIVFIYEPIKLTIEHVNSSGIKINTTKNGTINLPKLISSSSNPNHICSPLDCSKGKHNITSLNKIIWPGYILEKYEISNSKKKLKTFNYDLENESASNATTRIPSANEALILSESEYKNLVQKSVLVSSTISEESKGYKSDMTITFTYSNIGINVQHKDYTTKQLLKSKDGVTDLKYNMVLNGHSFVISSLNTAGEHTLNQIGKTYDISGRIIKEIKIYKENKQIGETITKIGNSTLGELTYCILASSDGTLVSYVNEIKKMGNDVTIEFYYQLVPILTVKHQDDKGNMLSRDEIIVMESGDAIVYPKDFSLDGYENDHYEDENGRHDMPYTEVKVANDGNNKTVIFVYKRNSQEIEKESEDKKVVLKSNERNGEEYNVEVAIPTSEDLYANVITNSFVLNKVLDLKPATQKMELTLVQQYYKTSDTDNGTLPNDDVYAATTKVNIELPYEYYSASGVQLDILAKAVVKNNAIISIDNGATIKDQVTVLPNYENLPELNYEKGGNLKFVSKGTNPVNQIKDTKKSVSAGFYDIVYLDDGTIKATLVLTGVEYTEPNMSSIKKEYESNSYYMLEEAKKHNATVKMDKLSVTTDKGETFLVLSGRELALGRTYTITELKKNGYANLEATESPLIDENVLYRNKDIYVEKVTLNSTYKTEADIYYRPYQKVDENGNIIEANGDSYKKIDYTQEGNDVLVHTPVVNYAKLNLTENNKDNQLINSNGNVIVIGKEFTITMPNSGKHISSDGYGNKTYNYNGLTAKDENEAWVEQDSFAQMKQIKFDFGVVFNKVYYEKSTWIDLDVATENFVFMIPTWEEETWNNKTVKIYTRVVAENAPEFSSGLNYSKTENEKNADKTKYAAIKNFDVKVVGRMYDIQIRATNDTGWASFKDNKALVASQFPIGQAGQNISTGYRYGLKLGAKVFFDLKVDGGYGQTSDKIVAVPKYYYVSKSGGTVQEVDLYYHTISTKYVKMSENPIAFTTKMTQNNGTKYFTNYTANLGLTSQILKNAGKTYNYATENNIGDSSKILLNSFTRIVAYRTPEELVKSCKYYLDNEITNINSIEDNKVINSIGRWYGEFRVPASTVIAAKGTSIENVKNGQRLKDGYLVVAFEKLVTQESSNKEYLTYKAQWVKEGYENVITLPNGQTAKLPNDSLHAMAIYETTLKINNDYEGTGTH